MTPVKWPLCVSARFAIGAPPYGARIGSGTYKQVVMWAQAAFLARRFVENVNADHKGLYYCLDADMSCTTAQEAEQAHVIPWLGFVRTLQACVRPTWEMKGINWSGWARM